MAITNSIKPTTLLKAMTVWPDSMIESDFAAHFETLRAIQREQTARIQLTATLPDYSAVNIVWLNQCGITVDDCVDNECDFTGPNVSSYVQAGTIDQCKMSKTSVPIDAWRNNIYGQEDAEAMNLIRTMQRHVEYIARYAVGVINANLGVNTHTPVGSGWTGQGTTNTTIPASAASETATYGFLQRNAERNLLEDPYILTGEALAHMNWLARTSQGNGEGKGDALRADTFRIYEDAWNIDAVNAPALMFYLIQRGALAFASDAYFPRVNGPNQLGNAEVLDGNYTRFSIPNRFFPALVHDVERMVSCTAGVWAVNYRVKSRYKVFVNPLGCTATQTGLLGFTVDGGGAPA